MSLLFDALNRLQDNDEETKQQGGAESCQPHEPSGAIPPIVNSAVFLHAPEEVARGRPSVFSSTLRKPQRALPPVIGGIALLLLVGGGGAWFYLHDQITLVAQQNSKIESPKATGSVLVPPPLQLPVSQNPALPRERKEVPAPVQTEQVDSSPPVDSAPLFSSSVVKDVRPVEQASERKEQIPFAPAVAVGESSVQEKATEGAAEPLPEQSVPPAQEVAAKTPVKQVTPPRKTIKKGVPSAKKAIQKARPARQASLRHKTAQTNPASQQAADNASPVHIRLNPSEDSLQEGYAALTEGRLEDAEQKYLDVIAKRPHERDALLGLAVVAHRNMQTERASDLYQQVLREDPSNATATAALVNLSAQVDPVAAESRLKQLISRKQTSSELHHALGRVLARQRRWGEAQQSFFRAYSLAPDNLTYVYNLAVALDRLRQSAAALSYYEKLARLVKPGDAVISRDTILRRVQELQSALSQNP